MSSGYKVYNQLIGTVFSRVERCNNDDDTINFYIGVDSVPNALVVTLCLSPQFHSPPQSCHTPKQPPNVPIQYQTNKP